MDNLTDKDITLIRMCLSDRITRLEQSRSDAVGDTYVKISSFISYTRSVLNKLS